MFRTMLTGIKHGIKRLLSGQKKAEPAATDRVVSAALRAVNDLSKHSTAYPGAPLARPRAVATPASDLDVHIENNAEIDRVMEANRGRNRPAAVTRLGKVVSFRVWGNC